MPKLTIANQDYESFSEKITTPSIILTEISSDGESYYIPLFKGNYSDGSVVQLGDYNYTLGKLKVGDLRAAIGRGKIVTNIGIISKVSVSWCTTWVLTQDGTLYGCGNNEYGGQGNGKSGNGTSGNDVLVFTKRAENVKDVKCSINTTWYLTQDDELYGCGANWYGQQGSGDTEDVLTFTKRAENVKEFICSDYVTWYIDNNNDLYGCGYNIDGQQGSGDKNNVLTFTKRAENVKEVRCTNEYLSWSCYGTTWYLTNDGELYGCGHNKHNGFGLQGSGGTESILTFTKRAENVKEVKCSAVTTWYIDNNNDLYGCGNNFQGQQGTGDTTNVLTFTKRAENIKEFSCSDSTTWYVDNNNDLYGCGDNDCGNQGTGGTNNVLTFTKRAENVKEFSCDVFITWYLTQDGELYGCGDNSRDQQGAGYGYPNKVLTFTKRAENVKEFRCAEYTTWYIDNNNDLYGCGSNSCGQQGCGNRNDVSTFTKRELK